jgi:outer membrane protein assembly factor BamA
VDTLSFRVFPNYDLARAITGLPVPLKLGPIFSYSFVGQLTDSASVNATNMRGHGYKMGVGVGTDFGKIELQAGVNFLGSYSLSNNTSTGQSLSYSGYVGGVLSANYAILPWLAPGIVAEYGGYSKASAGGGASSDVNTLKAWSVGVGVTARYPFASETKKEGEVK